MFRTVLFAVLLFLAALPAHPGAARVCARIPTTCMTAGGDSPGYVLAKGCFDTETMKCGLCSNKSPSDLCSQEYPVCSGGNCRGCYTIPRGMRSYLYRCCDSGGKCVDGKY